MSAWITPKTNWVSTDYINVSDYNRIAGNLNYLKDLADELYIVSGTSVLPDDKQYSDLPYIQLYNDIETNLEKINQYTYKFDIGDTKTFYANQAYIDYEELNRIESWTLRIYETLTTQKALQPRLAFRLGGTKMFNVPRTSTIDEEENAYRLSIQLGDSKGELV